jgi:hypothetical protein
VIQLSRMGQEAAKTTGSDLIEFARGWTDEARAAALESRRAKSGGMGAEGADTVASHKMAADYHDKQATLASGAMDTKGVIRNERAAKLHRDAAFHIANGNSAAKEHSAYARSASVTANKGVDNITDLDVLRSKKR